MTALYNEIDPFAADWLRELMAEGLIAPGEVTTASIEDLTADDLRPFTQVHLFAGIGIWSLALRLAGWPDDRPVWTGSCPCQPFSAAGKGDGFADERHLWPAFHWLIGQARPPVVLGEQVASKDGLAWLDLVSSDMEASRYAFGAADLCAAGVGAPHIRQRLFWVAYAQRYEQRGAQPRRRAVGRVGRQPQPLSWDRPWPAALTEFRAVDDGIARCVAATDAARNAIVAQVAQVFIEAVMDYTEAEGLLA